MKHLFLNKKSTLILEAGSISYTGVFIEKYFGKAKVCIITDINVNNLYSKLLKNSLEKLGFENIVISLKSGEAQKCMKTVIKIYAFLTRFQFSKYDLIIALGGGVVGDIAGFVASTYLRGLRIVQIPTSLLAQVDSAIGGKNGINLSAGKNLIGTFKQPSLVIIDPNLLLSLPDLEIKNGIAEIIKYACISSEQLFEQLQSTDLSEITDEIIFECIKIKMSIVKKDKYDYGERMILNFGHTIGHALEAASNYNGISHGMAVAIGMSIITKASEICGLTKFGTSGKLMMMLKKFSLPYTSNVPVQQIYHYVLLDKKRHNNRLKLALIKSLGAGFLYEIKLNNFEQFLKLGMSYGCS